MKRSLVVGCAIAALALVSGSAVAGFTRQDFVEIEAVSVNFVHVYDVARGALGSARGSADRREQIGCEVYADASTKYVSCFARTANNTVINCYSENPDLVEIAASIEGDTYLEFGAMLLGGCRHIWVDRNSKYEPKQP